MKINFCVFFMLIGLGSINLNETLKASNAISNAIPAIIQQKPLSELEQFKNWTWWVWVFFTEEYKPKDPISFYEINWRSKANKISQFNKNDSLGTDYMNLFEWVKYMKEEVGVSNSDIPLKRVAFLLQCLDDLQAKKMHCKN